jgi:group I intron endonuclease
MSKISCIYKIENKINKKFYIGSTCNYIKRKTNHTNNLKLNTHANKHLQRVVNKYGLENFEFKILAQCPKEYLIKLEQWFIDNIKPEYNICKVAGSNKGFKFSEDSKKLISEKLKNRIFTEEHKCNIRNAYLGKKGKDHPAFGSKRTIDHINKQKQRLYKKIYQYDLNMNLLNIYNSVIEASELTKIPKSTIAQNARGRTKKNKKFIWKYYA